MIWALVILAILAASKKGDPHTHGSSIDPRPGSAEFEKELYKYLDHEEGGLNNKYAGGDKPTDEAPCKVPGMSPNPHTSAGVKKATYDSLVKPLNLPGTCEDFIAMSATPKSNSWYKIVDHFRKEGSKWSSNPVIAAYMGLWYWGGWRQALVTPDQIISIVQSDLSPSVQLRRLVDLRKAYFDALQTASGYGQSLVDEWKDRAERFYATFNQFT